MPDLFFRSIPFSKFGIPNKHILLTLQKNFIMPWW